VRIGLDIGYSGASMGDVVGLVEHADRVGVDSVWTAEAYGSDAATVLGYLAGRTQHVRLGAAILQMPARTPAMTAMTAMTLDAMSGGRLVLGLGVSGPQVVEGWHGVPYGRPLQRTREYVEIVRRILAREEPLQHDGEVYQIPYTGPGATGLGKPLKSILHPVRSHIPIHLAAIGPKNTRLTATIADGWLPTLYSPLREDVVLDQLDAGLADAGRAAHEVEIVTPAQVEVDDDLQAAYDRVRPNIALYVGGMGAKGRNFYNDLAVRYGFDEAAETIQDRYLAGDRAGAIAAVPDELCDEVALCGPRERVFERLGLWRDSRVDVLRVSTADPQLLADLVEHAA
jgi:F420-dependent oxidoreductase-like protein